MLIIGDEPPEGLLDAFWEYERALLANDVEAMDRLFARGSTTTRIDADGLVAGHAAIHEFRLSRQRPGARRIREVHVRAPGPDVALVTAVTEPLAGGRGYQTQFWTRRRGSWFVEAAQVATPAPAFDRRIWRVLGDPLVPASGPGVLDGIDVAVKDLFAVRGQRIGVGNPAWLDASPPQSEHAAALQRLLDAGAVVRGIARTDEFAFSLTGTNTHYGTPPNPRAVGRISGGSTSGPASAVSLGQVHLGLGTDTGGSTRVPAALQGLWGIRTTHGAVPMAKVVPLAPSFDTVGLLARQPGLLGQALDVLDPTPTEDVAGLAVSEELVALASPAIQDLTRRAAVRLGAERLELGYSTDWLPAFQTIVAIEAWAAHGWWLASRLHTLGADVRARFEIARDTSPDVEPEARAIAAGARDTIRAAIGMRALLLPAVADVAPALRADLGPFRAQTMRLTCVAGLAGLPSVSLPAALDSGLPVGLNLVGPPGSDRKLVELAATLAGNPLNLDLSRP